MHVIPRDNCLVCEKEIYLADRERKDTHVCPGYNNWQQVIKERMPLAPADRMNEIAEYLKDVITVQQCFSSSHKKGEDVFRMVIPGYEDILERLMKHEEVDGALHHSSEIVCLDCVLKMRKEAYEGEEETPKAKCPVCSSELVSSRVRRRTNEYCNH